MTSKAAKRERQRRARIRERMEMREVKQMMSRLPSQQPPPPTRTRKKKNRRKGDLATTSPSSNRLATVTIPVTEAAGRVICALDLNPRKVSGTTWYTESLKWSNWKPLELEIEVVPSASATTSGSYLYGWSLDSSLDLVDGQSAIAVVSSLAHNGLAQIFKPIKMRIPTETVQKYLFCSGMDRGDTDQGTFYVVLNSGIGNLTAGSNISFSVNLNVKTLWKNRLALPSTIPVFIYPDGGYENYFTDSSSNIAGGAFLTLKATEGGSPVPFPAAVQRAVYKFTGSSLKYCLTGQTSATAAGIVTHAAPVWNVPGGVLFVFKNEADATAYATTGNTSTCLPYVAAGPYVSPTGAGFSLLKSPPPFFTNRDF